MDKQKPFLNTRQIDLEAYDRLREQFLVNFISFRQGKFSTGEKALNFLNSMYYVLPATRHFSSDENGATLFLGEIDELQAELAELLEKNNPNVSPELIKKMDAIVRDFHKILSQTGFSG